jgi:hypothetical protein
MICVWVLSPRPFIFFFSVKHLYKKDSDTKKTSDTDCFELFSLAEAMVAAQKIQRYIHA